MDAARRALYSKFYPLVRRFLPQIHGPMAPEISLGHARNWEFEPAEKLDRAFTRLAARIEGTPGNRAEIMDRGINPGVLPELLIARDLICTAATQERYYFPLWWRWLVEELRREGMIEGSGPL